MLSRSQLCASFAARCVESDMVSVYEDGLIIYASVAEDTAKSIAKALHWFCRKKYGSDLEAAISSDGLWWAFILPGAIEEEVGAFLGLHLASLGKSSADFAMTDCRQFDHNEIDYFIELIRLQLENEVPENVPNDDEE